MNIERVVGGGAIVALVLALCGCGDGGPSASATAGPSAPGVPVVRIGAALSESGKYAREGKDVRDGYNLWVEMINARGLMVGGVRHKVEIVYYDDESNPDTTAKLTERLITKDRVQFLLGPYSSALTKTASIAAEKHDVILIEGSGSSEDLFERNLKNLFAVLAPAGMYPKAALEALYAKGARTVAIAYEDTSFPTSVAKGAKKWAKQLGMEVVVEETYPKDVADVSGIIAKLKAKNPDVFIGGGHYNEAVLFLNAAKEHDFCPKAMVMTIGPSSPDFVAKLGKDTEFLLGPTQWHPTMRQSDPDFGTAADYEARFTKAYGRSATYQAAQSTACGLALQYAIEQAGSLDTAAVRAALRALNVSTFFGQIQFDDTGKNVVKEMGMTQVLDGKIVLVAPGAEQLERLVYPMPAWKDRK